MNKAGIVYYTNKSKVRNENKQKKNKGNKGIKRKKQEQQRKNAPSQEPRGGSFQARSLIHIYLIRIYHFVCLRDDKPKSKCITFR